MLLAKAFGTATDQNIDVRQFIESKTNARKVFQKIKHVKKGDMPQLPNKCDTEAPATINVYSDGSWLFPLKQFLGIGGAGVWWPNRQLCRDPEDPEKHRPHPLSSAEKDLAIAEQTKDGVRLFIKIGGYNGSSTRTELAAGIVAICAPGPVHIGSDSEAFVNQANEYLYILRHNKRVRRKFKLISDGDYWEHFFRACQKKGCPLH